MQRKNIALAAILAISISMVYTALPAHAATYSPGVSGGNYVKYGVSETFTTTDPSVSKPQFLTDIDHTSSYRVDINTVTGNNVTGKQTQSFNNGTADKIMYFTEDVNTGAGNASAVGELFAIGTGLGQGDKVCAGTASICTPTFNSTQSRTYTGASRTVDVISVTQSFSGNTFSTSIYYDQASGILLEVSFAITQKSGSTQQYTTSETADISANQTNIFSGTIFGLSPLVFYGIIGAIVLIVIIVAVAMLMRMRKPATPAMPTGTTPPSAPPPAPGS